MRTSVICATFLMMAVAIPTPAQEQPAPAPAANSQAFIRTLCNNLFSNDARVRYSLSQALRTMGAQAVPVLEEKKRQTKNPHHKAFVDRTIARIKTVIATARGKGRDRDRQRMMREFRRTRNLDIDRVAMEANLTFEQIAKVGPLLAKAEKELADMMKLYRETNSFGDTEAWEALRREQEQVAQATQSALRRYVDPGQARKLKRQIEVVSNPFRGTRHEGGEGFGEGRGHRPDR